MQDYISKEMDIEIEQFRAVIFKNFLLRTQPAEMEDSDEEDPDVLEESDTPEMQIFEKLCNQLYILTE